MRAVILGLAILALGACGGSVEVVVPPPDGETDAPEGDGSAGGYAELTIVPYVEYPSSYFTVELSNAAELDGIYDAWCVDPDTGSLGGPYAVELWSSYANLPAGAVENPDNLDLVNYVINTFTIGDSIDVDFGDGTVMPWTIDVYDIQDAIWTLVSPSHQPWEGSAGSAIAERARLEGEGFVPACGEQLALIALPILNQDTTATNDGQVLALETAVQGATCE